MARFALALLVALRVADAQDVFIPARQLRGSANASIAAPVSTELDAELQCVPSNGECGGPGRRTETCCGNARCTSFSGSGIMKCVEEQPTCVPGNGECGGPGRLTETCCGDAKCVSSVGGGVMTCLQVHELAEELNSVQTENSSLSASSSAGMSAAASVLELASSQGCWSSNGFICEYVYGQATGCHETAAECVSATGKAPLCYEYNGAICVKVEGDTPSSNCHGTEALCEQAHHPFTPLKLLETTRGTELNSTGLSAAAAGPWCTPIADKCGGTLGPFKWHKKCCGNAKCQKLFGSPDGTMKCVQEQPEQQCVPLHRECGGPGRRTEACCQGTCERQRGSGVMKCVDKQCAAPHAECGGPGRLTLPCCQPELSCKAQFFSAVMKCM